MQVGHLLGNLAVEGVRLGGQGDVWPRTVADIRIRLRTYCFPREKAGEKHKNENRYVEELPGSDFCRPV